MAIILALISSALFGAGDFLGGVASRRTHVLVVVGASHVVGLFLILLATPFMADAITLRDLGIGAIAGVAGVGGITFLYHSLSRGPMAVVAPIAAVSNAAVPALWGIYFGDRLSAPQVVGVVLGLIAILLVSRVSGEEASAGATTPGLIGVALMDLTAEATTPWPLVSARVVSAGIALILLARIGRSPIPHRDEARGAIVGAGVLDMTANLAILLAVHHGMLSLVGVLGSLYPASTVLLARYVLQERMARTQVVGLVVALAAIGAIVGA